MYQKHMDSILLEVYMGLKVKGGKYMVLENVSKAKCLKNNARCFAEQKTCIPS